MKHQAGHASLGLDDTPVADTPPVLAVDPAGVKPQPCLSTHGGAGYAPGSYWKGNKIVCGLCSLEIENPRPTGSRRVAVPRPRGVRATIVWLMNPSLRWRSEPDWGEAVSGSPASKDSP